MRTDYSSGYGLKARDFRKGDRVELHPGCDEWMRGARYGEVTAVFEVKNEVNVRLDRLAHRITRVPADRLQKVWLD